MKKIVLAALSTACTAGLVLPASATWIRVFEDNFDTAAGWSYTGQLNGSGDPLIRHDGVGRVLGEFDQSNGLNDQTDPYVIDNSVFSRNLGVTLTADVTFRFGATLNVRSGTIPNTTEFHQIANFGLYNLGSGYGADRNQSDNLSGNAALVRDSNNLIEFNYFVNNDSWSWNPMVQGVGIAAMPMEIVDNTPYFATGSSADSLYNSTDMGKDNYLPEDTDLFVELTYFGDGVFARRIHMAVYTDAARTSVLQVNGVDLFYWTQPFGAGQNFALDQFAIVNYVASNWGGANTQGEVLFDSFYVDVAVPEPSSFALVAFGAVIVAAAAKRRKFSGCPERMLDA